jgi:hypothetical protein
MRNAVIFSLAVLALGIAAAATDAATAVGYCQYVDYPPSCVARPGVVLVPRPGVGAVGTVGVGAPRCWSAHWHASEPWRSG